VVGIEEEQREREVGHGAAGGVFQLQICIERAARLDDVLCWTSKGAQTKCTVPTEWDSHKHQQNGMLACVDGLERQLALSPHIAIGLWIISMAIK
jgi:hypothetical protein